MKAAFIANLLMQAAHADLPQDREREPWNKRRFWVYVREGQRKRWGTEGHMAVGEMRRPGKNMRGKETWRLHARVGILQGNEQDGAQWNSTEIRLSRGDRGCVIKTDTTAFPRREFSNSPGAALLRAEERNTNFLPSHNNLRVIGLSPMAACDWRKDF